DWGFTAPISVNIVPQDNSVFGAANITLEWDNTKYDFAGIDKTGGLFDGGNFTFYTNQLGSTSSVTINASRLDNTNFTTAPGNFIAKLNLSLKHPGYAPISFGAVDFRAFDGNGGQYGVYVTPHNTAVKAYLGDVATPTLETTGDGLVNFTDLTLLAGAYWSGVGNVDMANYKVKYDVGPTSTNTVYGLPTVDGKINFEDLVIFSMSYGLSANHTYPKTIAAPKEPVILALGEAQISGNETLVPVTIKGGIADIRGMQLTFNGKFGKFLGVSNGSLLSGYTTPVMLLSKTAGNTVNVDFAIMGSDVKGLNSEGELMVLRFEGKSEIGIGSAEIRNSSNMHMQSGIAGGSNSVPTTFGLNQNYPNPFNPSTIISYQLPKQSHVEVSIYNSLGQKVATLVNDVKEAGYYNVNFNASNLSSGVYFYQIKAGDFNVTKKMMLMK
ncbi:MAG: T9SS type A sorting domain-containing protein, partial [Bacteroidota bacterium]|nr:T9SS type A sorting domain-containing protein [Bacteroidota bacterium]